MRDYIEGSYEYVPAVWNGANLVSGGYAIKTLVSDFGDVHLHEIIKEWNNGETELISSFRYSAPEDEKDFDEFE